MKITKLDNKSITYYAGDPIDAQVAPSCYLCPICNAENEDGLTYFTDCDPTSHEGVCKKCHAELPHTVEYTIMTGKMRAAPSFVMYDED